MSKTFEKLSAVQQEVKAPKNNYNGYGGYKYRSAEDILAAVKPVLAKHGAIIVMSDEIVEVSGRIYVKATAAFWDGETRIEVYGYAREALTKKGMDDSQITGTASSYARKYALNGLLLLDDTKDADTEEYAKQTQQAPREQTQRVTAPTAKGTTITTETRDLILKLAGYAKVELGPILNGKDLNRLTTEEGDKLLNYLKREAEKNGAEGNI